MPSIGWTKVEQHPFSFANSPVEGFNNDAVFLVKEEQGESCAWWIELRSRLHTTAERPSLDYQDDQHTHLSGRTIRRIGRRHPLSHNTWYSRRYRDNSHSLPRYPSPRPSIYSSDSTSSPTCCMEHTPRLACRVDHPSTQYPFCQPTFRQTAASNDRYPRHSRKRIK